MKNHINMFADVDTVINAMSADEKAGQLFLLAYPGKDVNIIAPLIERFGICGCYLSQDNAESFEQARANNDALQALAAQRPHGIPLLLGVDQEGAWGVLVPHSHTGPGNLALGAHRDSVIIERMYRVLGSEMRAAHYNAIFAPCADTNSDIDSPIIGTRAFGEEFAHVAHSVSAAVRGLAQGGVISTLKHFPGHGATGGDTHRGIPCVEKGIDELIESDLVPFNAGVKAGVDIIMTSHIAYPRIDPRYPATLSATILNDIMRDRLGFTGVVLSDSMNMGAIRKNFEPAESTLRALQAGVDIVMLSEEHYDHDKDYLSKQMRSIEYVSVAIEQGREVSREAITRKLRRILTLKQRMYRMKPADPPLTSAEITDIEREAARGAITLIKDDFDLYPLSIGPGTLCVNATPRDAYSVIINPRGIGPNQRTPAFDVFWEAVRAAKRSVRCLPYEDARAHPAALGQAQNIILVTEDYPLPGEDMPKDAQRAFVTECVRAYGGKCLVVGLRSPYELADLPTPISYLCAYSSRACSARETARMILDGVVPRHSNR